MFQMKPLLLVVLMLFVFSFAAEAALMNGFAPDGTPVYLSDPSEIPRAIKKFEIRGDLTTEEGKIDYIISRIRTSQFKFIRNGTETQGDAAATFIRWKIGWYENHYHTKVTTLHDFVSEVLKGSEKTGKPYEIVLPDGTHHNAQIIFQNEANKLEELLSR